MFFYDWTLILLLPAFVLGILVQVYLNSTYDKYSKVRSASGMTGYTAARRILDAAGLYNVQIERIGGNLTDHFDPRNNVLRLSEGVYNSPSVAAIGVAAHECGHAIQYAKGYLPMKVRGALVGATNISSNLSIGLVLIGMLFGSAVIAHVGIILYLIVVFFQLVTLPVEFNASRRAVGILGEYLGTDEVAGVKKVLSAAALTYVVALISALSTLLRLFVIVGGSGRKRR